MQTPHTLEMVLVKLLGKAFLLDEVEGVNNVVHLGGGIFDALLGLLGRSIGTGVCGQKREASVGESVAKCDGMAG